MIEADIIFVQETHCDKMQIAKKWSQWWDGKCFWSFGTNRSCGVGILVSKGIANHIQSFKFDLEGRVVSINILINDVVYTCVNVYVPIIPAERKKFILNLDQYCPTENLILGGDFNFAESIDLDKVGGNDQLGE